MKQIIKLTITSTVVMSLLISMALMDGPDDLQAERDAAADYALAVADGGRAKCAELGRVPLWTRDGDLICRLPAGVKEAKL